MTVRKQELVRVTKLARGERDRDRENNLVAYYARLGTALEAERLEAPQRYTSVAVSADMGVWPPAIAALYADVEGVWKRVSTIAVAVRDFVDAALAARGVALAEGANSSGAGGNDGLSDARGGEKGIGADVALLLSLIDEDLGSTAVAASAIYATLGTERLQRDATSTATALRALVAECATLRSRCDKANGTSSTNAVFTLGAVRQLLALVEQNIALQEMLLGAVLGRSLAPVPTSVAADNSYEDDDVPPDVATVVADDDGDGSGGGR